MYLIVDLEYTYYMYYYIAYTVSHSRLLAGTWGLSHSEVLVTTLLIKLNFDPLDPIKRASLICMRIWNKRIGLGTHIIQAPKLYQKQCTVKFLDGITNEFNHNISRECESLQVKIVLHICIYIYLMFVTQ